MRTNIVIDEALMAEAMKAGPYKTKKDAVEAGLRLLARQAAYREILKWEGKLKWEGDEAIDWTRPPEPAPLTTGDPGAARPRVARKPEPEALKRRARR
ncbi:MAG: type II toxin-antitoxin system VapB family antitoxin [Proteobacteria bacterium]|nr:type II toxin-antitoxin system VapB family antitoxin [Pseudomonadota bacterium]